MGETQHTLFQPDFNRSVRVEARAERLTADAGALLVRELMDRSGVGRLVSEHVVDMRDPLRITHPLLELVRTRLLLDAQGYPDQLDANVLRDDPVLRLSVSSRRGRRSLKRRRRAREPEGLASQPTLSRLLDALTRAENCDGLARVLHGSAALLRARRGRKEERTFDLDSLPIEVHGEQPGSAYNGHYRVRCYHPIVLRDEEGFYLAARLREGNAHTAEGALAFSLPVLVEERRRVEALWLRIDAGFPEETFLSALEREGIFYVARLRRNAVLERLAAPCLAGLPGGHSNEEEERLWVYELGRYRAGSWSRTRRVVLVVVERAGEQGELFLEHFFLLTNASQKREDGWALVKRYRQRGTAEKDFGAWQNTLELRLSSSPRPKRHYRERTVTCPYRRPDSFAANEARLRLSLLAANLMHAASLLLARATRRPWSRERLRQLVLKTAARVLSSKGYALVVIERSRAALWSAFWRQLVRRYPARGSPKLLALPTPV